MTTQTVFVVAESCLAFFGALLASLALTPWIQSVSVRWGFVDRPDGGRKIHGRAVALGGGIAVFSATLLTVVVAFSAASARGEHLLIDTNFAFYAGLLGSATIIFAVGLVDDFVGLRGRYKLAGQILAVGLFVVSLKSTDLWIDKISFLSEPVEIGLLTAPFLLFWLLGAVNAINLIDGIDGLASSIGIVLCLTLAALAWHRGFEAEAIVVLATAGALLGFLRFNFAPASIYLGDAGSMLVGLIIGAIAIKCTLKGPATIALAVPFALWAIPALDSAAAILRRKLTGRSLFKPDRGHFHHSLLIRGWSTRQVVIFIGLICVTTCCGALLSYFFQREYIAVLTVAGIFSLLIVTKTFGHIEWALVRDRVRFTTRALTRRTDVGLGQVEESHIRLQGSQEWDQMWNKLTESAENHGICQIALTLDIPALHESFYASWKCSTDTDTECAWRITSPLIIDDQNVGNFMIIGVSPTGVSLRHISQLVDFWDPVEECVCQVIAELSTSQVEKTNTEDADRNVSLEDPSNSLQGSPPNANHSFVQE